MNNEPYQPPLPKWIRVKRYSELTGISLDAIHKKRNSGVWAEGLIWMKAPDDKVMIDWREADNWVEGVA